jgi:hypothetical protein
MAVNYIRTSAPNINIKQNSTQPSTKIVSLHQGLSNLWSAGIVYGGDITDNGDGTVNVSSGEAVLRVSSSPTAELVATSFNGQNNITLANNAVNYLYIDYNSGTPTIKVTQNTTDYDGLSKCILGVISREDKDLSIINTSYQNVDYNRKNSYLLMEAEPFKKAVGGILGSKGLNLTVTAGAYYYGLNKFYFNAFDTSVSGTDNQNSFVYYYRDGNNGWKKTSNYKQIDNGYFDDGSGTLKALADNTYKVDWVYILNGNPSKLAVVYGTNTYNTFADATLNTSPSTLPPSIVGTGVLLGRVILQKNATSLVIENAVSNMFKIVPNNNHNTFSGLQGGVTNEYYHLSSSQYNFVSTVNASSPSNNQILIFNGSNWVNVTLSTSSLSDVSISSPASNQALVYNGSKWANATLSTSSLSDVSLTSLTANQVLQYNGSKWVNATLSTSSLSDMNISSPAANQVIVFDSNSKKWVNKALPIDSLANVSISSPTKGQILRFDGTNWVNTDDTIQ